jgi:hypothetical protein
MTTDKPPIKARSRYTRWGDRSPEARAANAAYIKAYRARKRAAATDQNSEGTA